jgi:hypothetical protein
MITEGRFANPWEDGERVFLIRRGWIMAVAAAVGAFIGLLVVIALSN